MAEEEGSSEGFLSRWSRLKRAGGKEARDTPPVPPASAAPPAVAAPIAAPAASPVGAAAPPDAEPEPEIDLASLPPIESLTAGTDVTAFLRKGVPMALRNAALRRAWSVDPTIRDFIGPADYAWDWNVPGGAPGYVAEIASGPDAEALADRILGLARDHLKTDERVGPGDAEAGNATAAPGVPGVPRVMEGHAAPAEPAPPSPVRLSDAATAAPREPGPPEPGPPEPGPPEPGAREPGAREPGPADPDPTAAARLAAPPAAPAQGEAPAPRPRHGGAVPT
jgi:hypothetical protein